MSRREDIDNAIWHDPDFAELSSDARYLYLWSFTNPRCNMSGLYKLALAPVPAETGLTMKRVEDALGELAEATFAYYRDGVLWVRSRVAHLRSTNPNMAKSIAKDLGKLAEDHPLRVAFLQKYRLTPWLREQLEPLPIPKPKSETVSERSRNGQETVQGKGKGMGSGVVGEEAPTPEPSRDEEWQDWLSHYQLTTGRKSVSGSAEAQGLFNARRSEGVSLDDLKAATVGCHGDAYLRERKLDRPETILRPSKFRRYIELARDKPLHAVPPAPIPENLSDGLPELEAVWPKVSDRLRASLGPSTFAQWLEPLRPAGKVGAEVYLSAPETVLAWVQRRYTALIAKAFAAEGMPDVAVLLVPPAEGAEAVAA